VKRMADIIETLRTMPYSTISILLFALLFSALSILIQKVTTDINKVQRYSSEIKKWRSELLRAYREGDERKFVKLKRHERRIKKLEMELAKETFKFFIISSVVFITLFLILRNMVYGDAPVVLVPVEVPSFFGQVYEDGIGSLNFIWWYVLCSFSFGSLLRKLTVKM